MRRRAFLRRAGFGSAVFLGGGLAGRATAETVDPAVACELPYTAATEGVTGVGGGGGAGAGGGSQGPLAAAAGATQTYGGGFGPPTSLREDELMAATNLPPLEPVAPGETRLHEWTVTGRQIEVADGVVVDAWTYAGTVPGPVLRVSEGDRLRVGVRNLTAHPHNLHLHGRHAPDMDGWEPIAPGEAFAYEVTCEPFGLHPYHCHSSPLAQHIARGLYGAMVVDPPGGRPPAHEVLLVLGGWDPRGVGRSEIVTWNGVAGGYATYPIKVPVGELVRCYVLNMLEYEPVGSFHLHAQTFDVFRTGTRLEPDEHTDTVTLGQGERAIVEFTLPEPGRYMFHPHQHHLAERGAMGWFAAI